MNILITTTSFQDTPGYHHDLLNEQDWNVDYLRGPVGEGVLLPIIHKYDGVICGDDNYSREVLIAGKKGKLKVLSKYGVGLDKIDVEAAKDLRIIVTNCPGVNNVSVAEHVLALLFTFEKNVHIQYNSTMEGSWKRLVGNEIQGKTIGVIGLGSVGKEVVKKSLALGLKVIGYDLIRNEEFICDFPEMVYAEDISLVYQNSDIISLHVPYTTGSHKMINFDVINNKLKKMPILINTARGMLIDVDAVIEGLSKGKLKGYLTDVLAEEPITQGEKLKGLENVIITPHVGSRTYQSVVRQGVMSVNNLIDSLKLS